MDDVLDLFGEPVRLGHGRPGRPPHVPDVKSINRVKLLLLMEKTEPEIALALGISDKTLRKHYSRLLKNRVSERAQSEAAILERMLKLGWDGNASMMKLATDRIERERMKRWESQQTVDDKTGEKLGKKETLNRAAQTPTGGWRAVLGDLPDVDEETRQ